MSTLVILVSLFFRYRAEKQTDTQTNSIENRTHATAVGGVKENK